MQDASTQTYDSMQCIEAPQNALDRDAEYRRFFKDAHDRRMDEELNRASRAAKFRAYWDTHSFWLKQEEERLDEAADRDLCCFCRMPRQPGRAALRHVGELKSAHPRSYRVPNLRAHFRCLSAFRFMLSKRADAALASLGVTFNFDNV
jgi:hypothetical protein